MNFELFVTRRVANSSGKAFSRLIIHIAIAAVGLSLAVMIITTSLVHGFRYTITDKIYNSMGHFMIKSIDRQRDLYSYDDAPMSENQLFYPSLQNLQGVRHIQVFARKAGIIKTKDQIEGIIVKGVGLDFDWNNFSQFLIEGAPLQLSDTAVSDQLVLSKSTVERLSLSLGDPVVVYFIDQDDEGNQRQRSRKYKLTGIYNTGLAEFDRLFALCDIGQVRKINRWDDDMIGGFEVFLTGSDPSLDMQYRIEDETGPFMRVYSTRQIHPNIFDWIDLQKVNERIILLLMLLVALINMVTSLLILILERTNMIGILKALGAGDWSVRKIFLYNAAYIIGRGLFWGNVIGIGLCLLQLQFGLIRLPEESYYITEAPIKLDILRILLINSGTLVLCTMFLILPSWLITKIQPIKAIRFD